MPTPGPTNLQHSVIRLDVEQTDDPSSTFAIRARHDRAAQFPKEPFGTAEHAHQNTVVGIHERSTLARPFTYETRCWTLSTDVSEFVEIEVEIEDRHLQGETLALGIIGRDHAQKIIAMVQLD